MRIAAADSALHMARSVQEMTERAIRRPEAAVPDALAPVSPIVGLLVSPRSRVRNLLDQAFAARREVQPNAVPDARSGSGSASRSAEWGPSPSAPSALDTVDAGDAAPLPYRHGRGMLDAPVGAHLHPAHPTSDGTPTEVDRSERWMTPARGAAPGDGNVDSSAVHRPSAETMGSIRPPSIPATGTRTQLRSLADVLAQLVEPDNEASERVARAWGSRRLERHAPDRSRTHETPLTGSNGSTGATRSERAESIAALNAPDSGPAPRGDGPAPIPSTPRGVRPGGEEPAAPPDGSSVRRPITDSPPTLVEEVVDALTEQLEFDVLRTYGFSGPDL